MRRASSENVLVNVICVHCGTEHRKPLRWFRDHSRLSCEGCGYAIALQNEQLRAAINELRAVMSGLRRSSRQHDRGALPEPKSARSRLRPSGCLAD